MVRTLSGVLALVLCSGGALGDEKAKGPAVTLSADEKALIDLLNESRKKEKLPPLRVNATLCKAARGHAENMAKQEKMEHILDGKKPGQRVNAAGYDYRFVAENLAKAEAEEDPNTPASPPADIHKGWMDSKTHRDNILNPKHTEVGIGIARSKKGTYYYSQVFATPRRR
jgi:uncharacterized protein YkwD